MPKMKTRKCVAKRFRLTANGHVKRKCAYRSHLMYRKTTKQKRGLRKTALVDGTQERQIRSMLH